MEVRCRVEAVDVARLQLLQVQAAPHFIHGDAADGLDRMGSQETVVELVAAAGVRWRATRLLQLLYMVERAAEGSWCLDSGCNYYYFVI